MKTIRRISEEAAFEMAEREIGSGQVADWPVLWKEEWDATEAAVCLKATKDGYFLGASCDTQDAFELFVCEERAPIEELGQRFVAEMKASGNPLSGAVEIDAQ